MQGQDGLPGPSGDQGLRGSPGAPGDIGLPGLAGAPGNRVSSLLLFSISFGCNFIYSQVGQLLGVGRHRTDCLPGIIRADPEKIVFGPKYQRGIDKFMQPVLAVLAYV